jgi:hypothetical protein
VSLLCTFLLLSSTVAALRLDFIDEIRVEASPTSGLIEEYTVYELPGIADSASLLFISPPLAIADGKPIDASGVALTINNGGDTHSFAATPFNTIKQKLPVTAEAVRKDLMAAVDVSAIAGAGGFFTVGRNSNTGTTWKVLAGPQRGIVLNNDDYAHSEKPFAMRVSVVETVAFDEGADSPIFTLLKRQAVQLEVWRKDDAPWPRHSVLTLTQVASECSIAHAFACDVTPPTLDDATYAARWTRLHSK